MFYKLLKTFLWEAVGAVTLTSSSWRIQTNHSVNGQESQHSNLTILKLWVFQSPFFKQLLQITHVCKELHIARDRKTVRDTCGWRHLWTVTQPGPVCSLLYDLVVEQVLYWNFSTLNVFLWKAIFMSYFQRESTTGKQIWLIYKRECVNLKLCFSWELAWRGKSLI